MQDSGEGFEPNLLADEVARDDSSELDLSYSGHPYWYFDDDDGETDFSSEEKDTDDGNVVVFLSYKRFVI